MHCSTTCAVPNDTVIVETRSLPNRNAAATPIATPVATHVATVQSESRAYSDVTLDTSNGLQGGGGGGGVLSVLPIPGERPFKTYPRPSNVSSSPFYTSFAAPPPPPGGGGGGGSVYNGYPSLGMTQLGPVHAKPIDPAAYGAADCMNAMYPSYVGQTQHHHHHYHHQQMLLHNQAAASAAVEESLKQRQLLKLEDEDSSSSAGSNGSTSLTCTASKRLSRPLGGVGVAPARKDDQYWDKRQKNNDSAKRSREARRVKEEQISMRVICLEQENLQLRTELSLLKSDIDKLRVMLY